MRSLKLVLIFIGYVMATSFILGDSRSGIYIPCEARSIFSSDIDNDGHPDIICGHRLSAVTHWGGISVMKNKGNGYFEPADSFLVASGVGEVHCDLLDDNDLPDIFYCYTTSQPKASYMGIIFNYQSSHFTDVESISLVPNATVSHLASGDLDGDNENDLVFACYPEKKWGICLSLGYGQFTPPYIFDLLYIVNDIDVGDLIGNYREEVVLTGTFYGGGGITQIFENQASGWKYDSLGGEFSMVNIADMNNDGKNDVVCINDALFLSFIRIFENTGTMDFIMHANYSPITVSTYSSIISDINNDLLPDLMVLPGSFHAVQIFNNLGNFDLDDEQELLVTEQGEERRDIASADFDGNSFNDIALCRDFPDGVVLPNLLLYFNDGKGNFIPDTLSNVESRFSEVALSCFPNPFYQSTTIRLDVKEKGMIKLEVTDLDGKTVKTLMKGIVNPGIYDCKWEGDNQYDISCPQGVYIISLKTEREMTESVRIVRFK